MYTQGHQLYSLLLRTLTSSHYGLFLHFLAGICASVCIIRVDINPLRPVFDSGLLCSVSSCSFIIVGFIRLTFPASSLSRLLLVVFVLFIRHLFL